MILALAFLALFPTDYPRLAAVMPPGMCAQVAMSRDGVLFEADIVDSSGEHNVQVCWIGTTISDNTAYHVLDKLAPGPPGRSLAQVVADYVALREADGF